MPRFLKSLDFFTPGRSSTPEVASRSSSTPQSTETNSQVRLEVGQESDSVRSRSRIAEAAATHTDTRDPASSIPSASGPEPVSTPNAVVAVAQEQSGEANSATAILSENSRTVDAISKKDHYGIKVLHNPAAAVVDFVFVHGLTGSAFTTWSHSGTGAHGPRDLFPKDFKNARIMTYGYDADVVHFWNNAAQDDLRGYANSLLGDLAGYRSDGAVCTPI